MLTYKIQESCKECIGIDKSQHMIEEAKLNGCKDVRVVDCEKLIEWANNEGFVGYFDSVFSNAGMYSKKKLNKNEEAKLINH
ncbi:hypothetical protein GLOIN_2v1554988 [Rhizophagus irregularis DAOM 181602=DAOM 197198]|uniref:Methyltransferase domain-containing protein n=1 Tax=Rhizophagus irregularis (strain DAOM 181602 / DAOM 197198 / MUCL 43194) TaxID=747089 RepID=A0A2P4QFR3_RHIID|nr:hypothetical protein GLOIN_2v1554988 [Rhizophagus irregularis DAOM 181602=DAOM 197198]POG76483.1 hypothetical protein GLOIN_2v1554988 [Rhizophagus irregularis DAOM 181602=DAOM 197198]|eukprot:XP_025183349.1 hypothetical protein GLOIN_2v1554988 [Rhizophagus irregularis DAOM 181602=DAOM 197198]